MRLFISFILIKLQQKARVKSVYFLCVCVFISTNNISLFSALYIFSYPFPVILLVKVKVIPQQADVAQGVPGRLRPWFFMTFGTTRCDSPSTFTIVYPLVPLSK